jgi:small-conductance mechanosensitive channel
MNEPTNAAYGPEHKHKEEHKAITILGYRVPGEQVWMVSAGLFGLLVVLTVIVVLVLPTGIPILAAKFADGFLSYVLYFFAYMFMFSLILVVFFSLVAIIGIHARKTLL